MDEEPGLIDALRTHWRALAIFTLLVASAAIIAERRMFPGAVEEDDRPAQSAPDKSAAATPAAPETAKSDEKADSAKGGTPDAAPSVMSETVTVDARPAALLKGQGKWEGAAKTLSEALTKLNAAVKKAGLAVNGRPVAVFTKTDDAGFTFEAMAPLAAAPEGKPKLADGVEIGASPAGKALKFQHRGAYDEIDATYEAIAAYLDEKGLDTKDLIVEEYLTDFKGEDANVDVDIYVFLK
ncbi:GyrI-like domain-containing protein [Methylocystis parvus]|uniref:GyrI-like domain-containing protein n=1 Tax=Methylocystis parvus TaxID=134 RepID=A0A6B8MAC9_9HYPH|nr:GyrI-like domain-containing protein [Methylocystis parvus]QGM98243.1 GyrI-like domain-containing protein [Methylocystis parvus]WBK01431.1 GyrI-like domain-containing protein [Methylocystis parvus OBBP]